LLGGGLAFLWRPLSLPANLLVAVVQSFCVFRLASTVMADGPLVYKVGGWGAPLGIIFHADGLTALMLVMVAYSTVAQIGYLFWCFRWPVKLRSPGMRGVRRRCLPFHTPLRKRQFFAVVYVDECGGVQLDRA